MPAKHDLGDLAHILEELGEDSPDLTDDEVAGAISVVSTQDAAKRLERCPQCGALPVKVQYAVRRRQAHIYWRAVWICEKEHENQLVFRIDY